MPVNMNTPIAARCSSGRSGSLNWSSSVKMK
jgi:hypothetical protein